MPWQKRDVVEERIEFALRASREPRNVSRLCREYGISRPTGYLWKGRYLAAGTIAGVVERTRRPHRCPGKTSRQREEKVVKLRKQWGWGARKLQVLLQQDYGIELALRTINRIIDRNGLIAEEDRVNPATKRFERNKPNELWQIDFKGEFRNSSPYCFPLTILDDHSRYNLGIKALKGTGADCVDKSIVKVFKALPNSR